MALIDNVPALERIAANASKEAKLIRRVIAAKVAIEGGEGEEAEVTPEQLLIWRNQAQALNVLVKTDAATL